MANDFIAIDTSGNLSEIYSAFSRLSPSVRSAVVDEVSKYLLNVFRQYPSQKYVSRKQAYGRTFFTERQRRWFWANKDQFFDSSGNLISYKRTQSLRDGWRQIGRGEDSILANEIPHAGFVMGDEEQSRHMSAIGWKAIGKIVEEREPQIERTAEGAAKKGIKKAGFEPL